MTQPNELRRKLNADVHSRVFDLGKQYGLVKRGYYYRPNGHGYTDRVSEAWHLSYDEAKKHEYQKGSADELVSIVEFPCPDYAAENSPHALEVLKWCGDKVEEMLLGDTDAIQIQKYDGQWHINRFGKPEDVATAPSLELAICRFALALALSKEGV